MSGKKSTLRVVLSEGTLPPRVGDRVEIEEGLRRIGEDRPETLTLRILTQDPREPNDKAALSHGSSFEDGIQHFTGLSVGGHQFDLTLHQNYQGKQFIYGQTGYAGKRGGTAIWVAEDQEAGRSGEGKKPKRK